jgi:uncharacterized membrane protein
LNQGASVTVFAAVDSTSYNLMLLFHILLVVIGFAPAWLTPMLVRLIGNGDRTAGEMLEMVVLRFSLGGIAAAGFLGFGLAGSSKIDGTDLFRYKFSQAWLSIAIVLWIVQLAVIFFLARPAIKAFTAGDAAARGRVMMSTGITHLILVVMLYLMIFKPGL